MVTSSGRNKTIWVKLAAIVMAKLLKIILWDPPRTHLGILMVNCKLYLISKHKLSLYRKYKLVLYFLNSIVDLK